MVQVAVNQQDEQNHMSATVSGGLKAGALGLGLALAASAAAHRFHVPAYRNLTLPLKAFAVTSVTTASLIVGADSAARKYELSKYALGSGTQLEKITHHDIAAEEAAGIGAVTKTLADTKEMTTKDLVLSWGKEHRYSVVFGAWAASMVGSFGYISMTPLSFAQKLVQARMVAQGLTVVVLIASAGLTSMPSKAGGLSEDQIKREERENNIYAWKKNSPHAQHVAAVHDASAVVAKTSN